MTPRGRKLVRVARWIVFLPVGWGIFLAVLFAGGWLAEGLEFSRKLGATIGGTLGGAAAVWLGSRVAPSRRRTMTVLVALPICLFAAALFTDEERLYLSLSLLGGSVVGCYLAFRQAALDELRALSDADEELGHRYKGTTPFRDRPLDRKIFFGRDHESRSLLNLVLAERLVVLFAKSGMGKTSLINAGLVEPLRTRGYFPMAVRLADRVRGPVRSLFDGLRNAAEEAGVDCSGGDESSLWEFFQTAEFWSGSDDPLRPVLIIDQFEELFTLHTPEHQQELILGLAELVRGRERDEAYLPPPELKVVLALREDFLAELENLSPEIPAIFQHRFRLGPLTPEGAREAIVAPAGLVDAGFATAPFSYRPEAVDELLAFLARARRGGRAVTVDQVEPVQLQLVCHYLEEQVRQRQDAAAAPIELTSKDVGGESRLQKVLESFYDRTLQKIWPPRERRKVRRLCEKRLISAGGLRLTEAEEEIQRKYKVSKERLRQLVDARLLRAEPRLGGAFYEISHDRLVEPIRQSRRRRIVRQWTTIGAVAFLLLISLSIWWVAAGRQEARLAQRSRDTEVSELLATFAKPDNVAESKLGEIESGYSGWVSSRQIYGAMAFVLNDIAARFPDLRERSQETAKKVREAFHEVNDLKPPTQDEDERLNSRILIPGGEFVMGSPRDTGDYDEWPQHRVLVSDFYIQEHEVTNAEYRRFDPEHAPNAPGDHPVVSINWFDAMAYAAWLGGRLPTEAEWEYAARAGCLYEYCGPDGEEVTLDEVAWYGEGFGSEPHPVCGKKRDPFGLCDMHGNVWEWTLDWYGPYSDDDQIDPRGPSGGGRRVIRGGSIGNPAGGARSASRRGYVPEIEDSVQGFRVVLPGP